MSSHSSSPATTFPHDATPDAALRPAPAENSLRLRPLEREDLPFVHQLDNNANVMRYWFEEPFETFAELSALYDEHIHDQRERRFVVESYGKSVGLVELVEIDHVHRRAEFQIIIAPDHQGRGIASKAARLAMEYGFSVLNLYKIDVIRMCLFQHEFLATNRPGASSGLVRPTAQ